MTNYVILIGRITKIGTLEDNKSIITIAVTRNYKNEEGVYDTDFVDVTLINGIAENVNEYCKIGDLVGIKGMVRNESSSLSIVAEKVTFLSTGRKENE